MGSGRKHRAGARPRIRASLCALVFALSIGASSAYADDVYEEIADDISDEVADDISDEYADDVSEEVADSVAEENADDDAEDAAEDSGPSTGRVIWDAALLRPLNFIRLAAGCVLMVPVSAIVLPAGTDRVQDMADYFVHQPYWDTFEKPLGKF